MSVESSFAGDSHCKLKRILAARRELIHSGDELNLSTSHAHVSIIASLVSSINHQPEMKMIVEDKRENASFT